jgi:hypothetical protein
MTKRELRKIENIKNREFFKRKAEQKVLYKCIEKNYTLLESFIYVNNTSKIYLKCNIDDHCWYITYTNFIDKNRGCKKCCDIRLSNLKIFSQDFVESKVKEKCIKNNYTYKSFIYKGIKTKLKITCNINDHGEWYPVYDNFISGDNNCPKCSVAKVAESHITSQYEAEKKVKEKCIKNNYTYKSFKYINHLMILDIKCSVLEHKIWNPTYTNFVNSNHLCPECSKSYKKSEQQILNLLEINKLNYIYQYRTKWLIRQSIDFYLPEYNIAIEYQGIQHFKSIELFGGKETYLKILERDERKYNKCINNNIIVLYITDKQYKKIIPENYYCKVYTDEQELINEINRLINLKNK